MKLKPYQETGRDFLAARQAALLADEMGLGKTAQAITAAKLVNAKSVLVVCPASLKLNWSDEFDLWWGADLHWDIQIVTGTKAFLRLSPKTTLVTVVNYALINHPNIFAQLARMRFDVGIFDEAHYLKTRTAGRTKALLNKGGLASRCTHKWFLTGTPVLNRPVELYPILKACCPQAIKPYTTHTSFAKEFCDGYWAKIQVRIPKSTKRRTVYQMHDQGASNTDELSRRLRQDFMLRRLKSEVLPQLPPRTYQLIPMPSPSSKVSELVERELLFTAGDAMKTDLPFTGSDLAILRHDLALAKLPTALQLINDTLAQADKLVVFAYHRDVLEALNKSLEAYQPVLTMGGVSAKKKHWNVDQFQNDPDTRLFIGQITAAGTGITLTAAHQVLFVESSWVPGEIDQAVDRVHRIGQDEPVEARFLVIKNSLEENMLKSVIDKKKVINSIVNPIVNPFLKDVVLLAITDVLTKIDEQKETKL